MGGANVRGGSGARGGGEVLKGVGVDEERERCDLEAETEGCMGGWGVTLSSF